MLLIALGYQKLRNSGECKRGLFLAIKRQGTQGNIVAVVVLGVIKSYGMQGHIMVCAVLGYQKSGGQGHIIVVVGLFYHWLEVNIFEAKR